jgi:hypothetical protein
METLTDLHSTMPRAPLPPRARRPAEPVVDRGLLRRALDYTVAAVFEIEHHRLSEPTRGVAAVAQARQIAMYLAHVGMGLTLTEVGELFDRDRSTVSHACRVIEERREQPKVDRALEILEEVVRQLVDGSGEVD